MTKEQHRLTPLIRSRSAGDFPEQTLLAADVPVLVVRQVGLDS